MVQGAIVADKDEKLFKDCGYLLLGVYHGRALQLADFV